MQNGAEVVWSKGKLFVGMAERELPKGKSPGKKHQLGNTLVKEPNATISPVPFNRRLASRLIYRIFSAGFYSEHAGLTECGTVDSAFRSNQRIHDFAWTTNLIN